MCDYEKAQHILAALTRAYPAYRVVALKPEDVIVKCENSAELDFWYRRLCDVQGM